MSGAGVMAGAKGGWGQGEEVDTQLLRISRRVVL